MQAEKFLKGDWLERAVLIWNPEIPACKHYSTESVKIDSKKTACNISKWSKISLTEVACDISDNVKISLTATHAITDTT